MSDHGGHHSTNFRWMIVVGLVLITIILVLLAWPLVTTFNR